MSGPIIIPFFDDSTLFFALRMRDCFFAADPSQQVELAWLSEQNALSERQMADNLPDGPDMALHRGDVSLLLHSDYARAIVTNKMFKSLRNALGNIGIKAHASRPPVVAFLTGLEFSPEKGFSNRKDADIIYALPRRGVEHFSNLSRENSTMWQEIRFGHPTFLHPKPPPADLMTRRDIYFFAQALSPSTRDGRIHMLRALSAMAAAHRTHNFWIKLRHLPNENKDHTHKERFDYPGLLEQLNQVPSNLRLTTCTMDQALETCALGIVCTSTAVIDLIREGIPSMVYLDYVDAPLDTLRDGMQKVFAGSGIITTLEDMLNMNAGRPTEEWIAENFCERTLGEDVLCSIDRFRRRAFKVQPHSELEALREASRYRKL